MAAHLPPNHDAHDADKDALAWLTVQLGAEPLVPPDVRETGDPHRIISAALSQLRTLAVRVAPAPAPFRFAGTEYLPPITRSSQTHSPRPK
jgi:hypothetical protein